MGGKNETIIAGLRMHVSNEDVHIHDDDKGLKFQMDSTEFKDQIEDALKQFKKNEGITRIVGRNCDDLYLLRVSRVTKMFLSNRRNVVKRELEKFLRSC